ncbi:MAG: VWA domain-containing protein [Armatimonadota bacterium]
MIGAMQQYVRWAHPELLKLLWLTPLVVALYVHAARARWRAMRRMATPLALDRIAGARVRRRRRIRAALMTGALVMVVLAAARPQFGTQMTRVQRRGADVVFAIDTSQSMLARDIAPDRLGAAKDAVRAVVSRMRGDRVGIVAFAGAAFQYCPLTIDYGATQMFLDALDTKVIGDPGTALADAIREAADALEAAEHHYRHLVILTDGEDHEGGATQAAREAASKGITIHVVGVGSTEGEPVPILDAEGNVTGHKRGPDGEVVVSRLDEQTLREVAEAGNGSYVRASDGGIPVDRIYSELSRREGRIVGTYQFTEYAERYQLPLGVAIVLVAAQAMLGDVRGRRS